MVGRETNIDHWYISRHMGKATGAERRDCVSLLYLIDMTER